MQFLCNSSNYDTIDIKMATENIATYPYFPMERVSVRFYLISVVSNLRNREKGLLNNTKIYVLEIYSGLTSV